GSAYQRSLHSFPTRRSSDLEVELYSNYPNPFNPSTTIRFGLPEQAEVRITIYNTDGQEIAALLDAPMPAGTHEIRWDAAGLTSGTYFCRLQAGNESRVHPILLLKQGGLFRWSPPARSVFRPRSDRRPPCVLCWTIQTERDPACHRGPGTDTALDGESRS